MDLQFRATIKPKTPFTGKTLEIISAIEPTELRRRVHGTLRLGVQALNDLGGIDLPQDHFEERQELTRECHPDLAAQMLQAVTSLNSLLADIVANYSSKPLFQRDVDADFDLEFDLVDGPTGESLGLSAESSATETSMSEVTKLANHDFRVAEAAYSYAGILRSRVLALAERLRDALECSDFWVLLAELNDHHQQLTKAVQGLIFGLLGVFEQNVRRDEIIPSYRSAVGEAVRLRVTVADFTHYIARVNAALADASPEAAIPLVAAIADRFQRFSRRTEYRTMRAEDKKAVIDFRSALYHLRHDHQRIPMAELRDVVEGFYRFLESMGEINRREVLILHDRKRMDEALDLIKVAQERLPESVEDARAHMARARDVVSSLIGRNPDLDYVYRYSRNLASSSESLSSSLSSWQDTLRAARELLG